MGVYFVHCAACNCRKVFLCDKSDNRRPGVQPKIIRCLAFSSHPLAHCTMSHYTLYTLFSTQLLWNTSFDIYSNRFTYDNFNWNKRFFTKSMRNCCYRSCRKKFRYMLKWGHFMKFLCVCICEIVVNGSSFFNWCQCW